MAITSVAGLVAAIQQHGLLTRGQLDELTGLPAPFSDPKALAKELIQRGWLTPYQVNQLFQGRADNLVLGHYILLERLGEGGMGQVFKARHGRLGRVDAVKVIRREHLASPRLIRRFYREIQSAAQLSHPNIVHAYDAGEGSGVFFFAMEYVQGMDLAQRVKKFGPVPVCEACDYIRQAALGLQHALERGLIHRDIKPANLLLSSKGSVIKILDLGLARLNRDPEQEQLNSTLTTEGAVVGTLDFLAPEQAMNSSAVDIRADLYSLGCTFYYLLTGQVPFPGGEALTKLARHRWEEPAPVEELRPGLDAGVAAVVRRLMAKEPEDRFQTPAELASVLAKVSSTGTLAPASVRQAASAGPSVVGTVAAPPVAVAATLAEGAAAGEEDWEAILPPAAGLSSIHSYVQSHRTAERRRWERIIRIGGAVFLVAVLVFLFLILFV